MKVLAFRPRRPSRAEILRLVARRRPALAGMTTYSRRRSVSIAALSAGSVTPSSLATCPHRIGRRLDFRETGHFEQASTSRSSFAGRCFAAHLWQAVRSENTRPCIVKTRPARNHAW